MAAGLNFFYKTTLQYDNIRFKIPKRKQARKLPTIFSRPDLKKLFEAADTLRNRVMLITAYSAGLRLSELVSLKPEHIESGRKLIRVEQGRRLLKQDGLKQGKQNFYQFHIFIMYLPCHMSSI